MAHREQKEFCEKVKTRFPEFFKGKDVLDIGSLDINGCNKPLFEDCTYTGVDVGEGKNVDVVSLGHEYNPGKQFDVIVSTECFEHDVHHEKTLLNIVSLLKEGGLFFFTCGGYGCGEHGTLNTSPYNSPLLSENEKMDANYYANMTVKKVVSILKPEEIFEKFEFDYQPHDLRFWGIKKTIKTETKSKKIGVLIPTRSKERKEFLEHALYLLSQQSVQPDFIEIVDDEPISDEKDITYRYRIGFKRLVNKGADLIFAWEDDDWYHKDYIKTMINLWYIYGRPDCLGFNQTIYYNIKERKYVTLDHPERASMFNTLVTKNIVNIEMCPDNDVWTDMHIWKTVKKSRTIKPPKTLCIGIKHNIGLCGGVCHTSISQTTRRDYIIEDKNLEFLGNNIDENSLKLYEKYYEDVKEVYEMDVIIPSCSSSEHLRKMTQQCINNCFYSDRNVKFNIYVLENKKTTPYDNATIIYYDFEFNYNKVLNIGIRRSKSKYICMCNNDVNFSYGWATIMIDGLNKYSRLSASPFNPITNKWFEDKYKDTYDIRDGMNGWCIVVDRTIFKYIQKLDESVSFWRSEAVYIKQLIKAKIKHSLFREAVVYHYDSSETLNTVSKEKYSELTIGQSKKYVRINSDFKLGASYNVGTGIEMLEHSIKSIRDNVDYIVTVYTNTSFTGKMYKHNVFEKLNDLRKRGLIDAIELYKITDYTLERKTLERNQRNIGLAKLKEQGCTHFISMDVDELYLATEFENAINEIRENNYDSSVCKLVTYYKDEKHIIDPPEEYFVSFIYKIIEGKQFEKMKFPYFVDPSRRYNIGKIKEFKRDEIQMHHFSYVRNDIQDKLLNAATQLEEKSNEVIHHYNNFKEGQQALTLNGFYDLKVIEPYFNINSSLKQKLLVLRNKLGVAYSVFDDLDHLEQSLLSIRDNVDFITIVYQNVSYTGIQAEFNIYSKLVELKNKKLIDGIEEYKPDFNLSTKENEVKKRNLGLLLCKQNYCTHHITMDGDEIYVPAQFKKAKAIVYDYQYEASFVLSRTYYKSKSYYINPPEQYHIPFIYKISDRKFEYQSKINLVSADSSRIMNNVTEDIMIFERQFIEMHHLCYVRKDLKRKLQNKASNLSEEKIEKILNSYDNFKLLQLTQEVYTENGTFNVRLHLFPAI